MSQGFLLLNRYEIHSPLGQGGSSDVVRAIDRRMEREVAIKRLPNNPHTAPRALREARTLALLNHPNIITVYDFVEEKDYFYIVMEIAQGRTLQDLLPDHPLPVPIALGVALQAAWALEYAHANEIVHRDIKPANLVMVRSGRIKVLDFGIARLRRAAPVTSDGHIVGTIGYLAPEQAEAGVIDDRTDLFLFAILLYRMLTGIDPFHAETPGGIIYKILNIDPAHPSDLNPDVPRALGDAIMRALEKHPDDRYDSVTEFRYKLERFADPALAEQQAKALYDQNFDAVADSTPEKRGDKPIGDRVRHVIGDLWHGSVGKADPPISAALSFLVAFAAVTKAFEAPQAAIVVAAALAIFAYLRPRLAAIPVLLILLATAADTHPLLLALGIPLALAYLFIWRKEEGFSSLLPFTAPLLANIVAASGVGLGLLYPFLAGYTLAPLQAGVSAVLAGFFVEGYDLLYRPDVRFLEVAGPQLASGEGAADFFIQLSSPFVTNPFLLLQPVLLGAVAFIIASFRARGLRVQSIVAAAGLLLLLFGFSFFLAFSPDQGAAFQKLVKQILAAVPILVAILVARHAYRWLTARLKKTVGRERTPQEA